VPKLPVALLTALVAIATDASASGARHWFGDDSDPEIQRLIQSAGVTPYECFLHPEPPERCDEILAQGERLIDYMLVQYEHARLSSSRIHRGKSLVWLRSALSYAARQRSPTARRYVLEHRDELAAPPADFRHDTWTQELERVLRHFDLAVAVVAPRHWFGDDWDPEIQRLIQSARVLPYKCFLDHRPPEACFEILTRGERLIDYMLAQYERARLSPSQTHQGESLTWLWSALSYANQRNSATAERYVVVNREQLALAPPDIRPEYWSHQLQLLLRNYDLARAGD
jgi:hypothetical protein